MINFILGKSKTGKTTHIYNMIEQDILQGKEVILFVPSQCRAKAENEYMRILNKEGVMGVNITTISEFIKQELKIQNLHIDENYMSKLDRKIILTQVIKENQELFNAFDKVKNYPGFLDTMDIYMDIFRKNDINPKEYSDLNIEDKRVDIKFKEILAIYEKYLNKIQNNYIDSVDEMDIFLKNINRCQYFIDTENINVYFDGYNNFSNIEYKFLDMLMKKNINVTITLNTDIAKIEDIYISSSIFENSNNTYKRICALANKNKCEVENTLKYENKFQSKEDIKYIASNIFSSEDNEKIKLENIDITIHTNAIKEIEYTAKVINEKIKQGYRYSDFAIYTTNISEYEKIVSRIFYENNIQVYIPKTRNINDSLLTKYIQSILKLASNGLNLELIFDILKLGLTDIDLKDVYLLENYLKEFNVNKYLVNNKLTLNNEKATYDLDKLNSIKDDIVSMYSFVLTLKKSNCKEIISAIYNHLNTNNIFENFSKTIKQLENDAINLDISNFETQIWDNICEIFNSMVKIYKEDEITIEEFENIFNLVVKDISIKTLPPTKDQIELLDINVSKVEAKKIIFFIGVVEGKFPQKVEEDIFFNDNELEKLKNVDINLKETTISKLNMGLFNIYEALNNVSEKLYIFIPAASLDGKATRKSSFITLLEQISIFRINGKVTEKDTEENIYNILTKDELFMWLIKNIKNLEKENDLDKIKEIVSVYNYFLNDERYANILKYKKDDSKLSKEITDIVYSNEFKTSVSRLEVYKKCPFSYFMQYILKVMPNKEAKVNVIDLGNFMHKVLEEFSKLLLNKNIKWQEILTEDLEDIKPEFAEILEEIIDESMDNILSKQKQSVKYIVLKRKLTNTMKKVIKTVAISYNQSEFEPYGYEIEFKDNGILLPMIIKLDDNKTMKIIGKIDRVDILKTENEIYARIVDYKSSSRELSIDKIKEGITLQLISYLMVFLENNNNKNIKPAGMLYFNLSDKLVSLGQYINDNEAIKKELIKRLKMKGIFLKDLDILTKMDRNFQGKSGTSLIDVSTQSLNRTDAKKVLDEKEFENLCNDTKELLRQIGKEISSGIVKILPNKKADACKYCQYSTTCRKNIEV